MLQIKKLNLTHKKDLRIILNDFNLVLNDGDKAVIIGEEGNGKSTLMKWIYNPSLVDLNQLGAVVTKGVANIPWAGNSTPRVAEVYGGMLNAVGLQMYLPAKLYGTRQC